MNKTELRKLLLDLWFDYQDCGTPEGNSFQGLMVWLTELEARSSAGAIKPARPSGDI